MVLDPTILVCNLRAPSVVSIWCRGRISPIGLIGSEIFLEWCSPLGSTLSAPMLVILWITFTGGTGVLGSFGFRCFFRKRSILMWENEGSTAPNPITRSPSIQSAAADWCAPVTRRYLCINLAVSKFQSTEPCNAEPPHIDHCIDPRPVPSQLSGDNCEIIEL